MHEYVLNCQRRDSMYKLIYYSNAVVYVGAGAELFRTLSLRLDACVLRAACKSNQRCERSAGEGCARTTGAQPLTPSIVGGCEASYQN